MTTRREYHSNFADARRQWTAGSGSAVEYEGDRLGAFDRLDWYEGLHAAICPHSTPLIAHAQADAARTWLFLAQDGAHMRALANYYSFAWRPVSLGPPDPAALAGIAHDLKARAATLELAPLPDADVGPLAAALREAGWIVEASRTGTNHWLETGGRSFAAWWAQRPGALRSTVQRKARKDRVQLSIETRFDETHWDQFEAVYAASWKPAESHPLFLRDWARRASREGTLRLGIARIDGEAAAAQFWVVDRGTAYIVKLAHVARHDALSPGTLLTHAMFARAFDTERVRRIDFGTGDDGYKRDWMECSAPLHTLYAWNPAWPAAWPGIARSAAKRVATALGAR